MSGLAVARAPSTDFQPKPLAALPRRPLLGVAPRPEWRERAETSTGRLAFASRSVPSDTVTGASGDWYDVLGLPGEKVAIVVGDAVGRGRPASRSKEVLQTAVRRLAAGGARPGEVIAHLRQMIGPFDVTSRRLPYIEANASEQGEPGGRTGPVLARTAQGKRDRNLRRRG